MFNVTDKWFRILREEKLHEQPPAPPVAETPAPAAASPAAPAAAADPCAPLKQALDAAAAAKKPLDPKQKKAYEDCLTKQKQAAAQPAAKKPERTFTGERLDDEELAQMGVLTVAKYAVARAEKCNDMGNISVGSPKKKLVQQVQAKLKSAGAKITDPEGEFGKTTLISAIQFQKKNKIRVDGCIGPETAPSLGIVMPFGRAANVKLNPEDPNQPPVSRIGNKSRQPSSTVGVPSAWGGGTRLDPVLAALVNRLQKDAAAAGVPGVFPRGKVFLPSGGSSGLRSLEKQEAFWQKALEKYGSAAKARMWVAMPISQGGQGSPHTTGRAIDFFLGMPPSSKNNEALKTTAAFKWLAANGHKYGLAQYPNEAWHWELNIANRNYFAKLLTKSETE